MTTQIDEVRARWAREGIVVLKPRAGIPSLIHETLHAGFHSPVWQRELERLAQAAGAQHVGYGYATGETLVMPFCSTLPTGFVEEYAARGCQRRDPVPRAIARSSRPLFFDGIAGTDTFREIFVDRAGSYGMRTPTLGVPLDGLMGHRAGVAFYGLEVPPGKEARARLLRRAGQLAHEFHRRTLFGLYGF
jgi:hypothetical protein